MKKTVLISSLLLSGLMPAFAGTISARDAPGYYGRSATVVGRASVQRMASGEIYIDLEGTGDGAPVSAYVSRWNAARFSGLADIDGKLVAVRGEIGSFRYRREIFLTDSNQIAVIPPPVARNAAPRPLRIHIVGK